jgi:TPR repeat protein
LIMRHFLSCLLLVCASAASAQVEAPDPLPLPDLDLDVLQGGPAWLVGDHVKARRHFRAAAERGHPLGQYNLAMMLLYREGGPCGAAEAVALLHQASDAGVGLAREALAQVQNRGIAQQGLQPALPCLSPRQAHSTPAIGPIQPTAAR